MNNSERLIWLSILILGTFFCNDKISKIENLELMIDHQKLSRSIQSDQIIEIRNKYKKELKFKDRLICLIIKNN